MQQSCQPGPGPSTFTIIRGYISSSVPFPLYFPSSFSMRMTMLFLLVFYIIHTKELWNYLPPGTCNTHCSVFGSVKDSHSHVPSGTYNKHYSVFGSVKYRHSSVFGSVKYRHSSVFGSTKTVTPLFSDQQKPYSSVFGSTKTVLLCFRIS